MPHGAGTYETSNLLEQYMALHWGSAAETLPYAQGPRDALHFPQRCAQLLAETAARMRLPTDRALDIGCAVGGAAFELARTFGNVIGVDLSSSFVRAASVLKREGRLAFTRRDEAALVTQLEAIVDPSIDRARVAFSEADACALPAELVDQDAVLLANVLCRLPSPRACLERMSGPRGVVRQGGLLVVTSPYSWSADYTPEDAWLGGLVRDGEVLWSADGLRALLAPAFDLIEERDMPLVIREHARKYQYIVSHATVWRRRAEG